MGAKLYNGPLIEPHIHAHTRSTDDLRALKEAGVVALVEPAFWSGIDKRFPQSFFDYFSEILDFEQGDMPYGKRRASKFGLQHFCLLGVNAKEAENLDMVNAVLEMSDKDGNLFQRYLSHPRCLGVGEIGLNRNTKNEIAAFRKQLQVAKARGEIVIIHTPHDYSERPQDRFKVAGTKIIIEVIRDVYGAGTPCPFIDLDHTTDETIDLALSLPGAYVGFTLYPTKMSIERVIPLLRAHLDQYDRFLINGSADWDDSDPLAVPRAAEAMIRAGFSQEQTRRLVYENPDRFLSQSAKYRKIMASTG